jgi:hypothetical protein
MRKKLIWLSLLALVTFIPAMVRAHGHKKNQTSGCVNQEPAAEARADVQPQTSAFRSGWDTGYKSGYQDGQTDHNNGAKLDADDAPGYKGYRSSFDNSMGKRSEYKKGYREGFNLGYQDGYSGLVSRLIEPKEEMPAASNREQTLPEAAQNQPQPSTAEQQPPAKEPSNNETAQAQPQPKKLPRTASGLPWLALLGLSGVSFSLLLRTLRSHTS